MEALVSGQGCRAGSGKDHREVWGRCARWARSLGGEGGLGCGLTDRAAKLARW